MNSTDWNFFLCFLGLMGQKMPKPRNIFQVWENKLHKKYDKAKQKTLCVNLKLRTLKSYNSLYATFLEDNLNNKNGTF